MRKDKMKTNIIEYVYNMDPCTDTQCIMYSGCKIIVIQRSTSYISHIKALRTILI